VRIFLSLRCRHRLTCYFVDSTTQTLSRCRRASQVQRARASSIISKPLHLIVEEIESSTSSPAPAIKSRRRHCNLSPSDIQIAKDFIGIGEEDNTSDSEDRLLLVPPSSSRLQKNANLSPASSPDSFRLDFPDQSFEFPYPPVPTPCSLAFRVAHPYGTASSTLSSPDDDYVDIPSPKFNPRRAVIRPLTISKRTSRVETHNMPPSPFTSEESSSDSEADIEWYSNELAQILTISFPQSSNTTQQRARADSVLICHTPTTITHMSQPSGQATPAFTRRRQSRISTYAPPSLPKSHRHISHLVPSSPSSPPSTYLSFSSHHPPSSFRPPPRSSVPADFDLDDGMFEVQSPHSVSPLDEADFELDTEYQSALDSLARPLPPVLEEASFANFSFSPPLSTKNSWESFYVSEGPSSPLSQKQSPASPTHVPRSTLQDHTLKSKWSSSTLGSIREELEPRRFSSRFRLFSPTKKRASSKSSVPQTPSSAASFLPTPTSAKDRQHWQESLGPRKTPNSASRGAALRRQTSLSSIGSNDSDASTYSKESNGQRRRPNPLDMLVRG